MTKRLMVQTLTDNYRWQCSKSVCIKTIKEFHRRSSVNIAPVETTVLTNAASEQTMQAGILWWKREHVRLNSLLHACLALLMCCV